MEMSFAQALTEAKQVIVQQSNRIKADADKIKQQQQTIVDQCSIITEHEMKLREQTAEVAKQQEQIEQLDAELAAATVAREQAEAVCDRQGQRLTGFQTQVEVLERKLTELADSLQSITRERDELKAALPSREDAAALAEMAALLTTKKVSATENAPTTKTLRISDESRAQAA